MAKKELNPLTDTPKNKLDITKNFMYGFVKSKGNEEMKWFAEVVSKHIIEKKAPNSQKGVRTYDVKPVRDEFCKKYFPNLIKSSKAEEELNDILSWLNL